MYQSKRPQKKLRFHTVMMGMSSFVMLMVTIFFIVTYTNEDDDILDSNVKNNALTTVVDSDLIIPIRDITETVKFYPITIDGTDMEIIAVKGTDGQIQMAFNTCEICYSSGKGYYKQSGNHVVCQNCGNSYTMDQVGQLGRGGCNPYSIFATDIKIDSENITISKDFLAESTFIFANWK